MINDYFTEEDFKQFCLLFDKAYCNVTKEYNKLSTDFINKRTKKDRLYKSGVDNYRDTQEYSDYREAYDKRREYAEQVYKSFKKFSTTLEYMKEVK